MVASRRLFWFAKKGTGECFFRLRVGTKPGYSLNKIIGNAKRFIAYEIIKRLEGMKRNDLLEYLFDAVTKRVKKKMQRHKVFDESFDAKGISSEKFLLKS